jgi:hypothetical protein
VLLFGDSVMRSQAPAVQRALGATGVVSVKDDGFDGWGLTTDTGWRTGVPAQIRADRAQLVVAMWSFDDGFLVRHPIEYRRWLSSFTRLVIRQTGVEGLVYEQFPPVGPYPGLPPAVARVDAAAANRAIDAWNSLARRMVRLDPHRVVYLPVGPALEHNGHFAWWLPPGNRWSDPPSRWVRVRTTDGVHMCSAGAARYAHALLSDLHAMLHLPAASRGWTRGPWTHDPALYAGCPDDDPPT